MLNDVSFRLMHRHGDDYVPMVDHGAPEHDPEKSWLHGARIFRCKTCAEEIVFIPSSEEPGDSSTEPQR
ncbi:MAG TPA: hypothetical protein VHR16_02995 [Candidatus Limnocylindrales bacterium]|jgi:hypothetical protein|nr:hypothetical protein [Candidatus Limnocylindrales bacterium]